MAHSVEESPPQHIAPCQWSSCTNTAWHITQATRMIACLTKQTNC